MKSNLSQSNGYLEALEKKERKRRRNKLFLLGAAGIILAGSAVMVPKLMGKKQPLAQEKTVFRSFYATELTDDKVRTFFTGGNNRMVIRYPGEDRRDTVSSYNEYSSLISRRTAWQSDVVSNSDLFSEEEGDDSNPSAVDDALQAALGNDAEATPVAAQEDNPNGLNDFGFRVRGERNIGKDLNIQVLNFRSDIKYEMDFGNGVRKEIDRKASISYDEPGVYVITLRASGEGVPRRIYATYPLTIEDPNAIQIEAQPIAENATPATDNAPQDVEDAPTLNDLANATEETSEGATEEAIPETVPAAEPVNELPTDVVASTENKPAPANNTAANQPFFAASKMPEFPGGNRGLNRYIQRNLRYPNVPARKQKSGKVTVRVLVDENGKATSPHVVKGLGNPYDAEVLRMIGAMPKWSPGEQNGKKVPVYRSLRISFNVNG